MAASPIAKGKPFNDADTRQIVDSLHREGFVHIPSVLEPDEIVALRKKTDSLLDNPVLAAKVNPDLHDRRYVQIKTDTETGAEHPFILRNTIELDPIFLDMLLREPILSLAEAIVGPNCRFCGQNVLRSSAGVAIENWHCDGAVHFPVPDDIPRHDARDLPCFGLQSRWPSPTSRRSNKAPHNMFQEATFRDASRTVRNIPSLKGRARCRFSARQATFTSRIRNVGTAVPRTLPIERAI